MTSGPSGEVFWRDEFGWDEPAEPEPSSPSSPTTDAPRKTRGTATQRPARVRTKRPARGRRLPRYGLLGAAAATLAAGLVVLSLLQRAEPSADIAAPPRAQRASATVPRSVSLALVAQRRPLRLGHTGEAVRTLQETLGALRFDTGPPDGRFGQATRAAVAAFQRAQGLRADGVAGRETAEALATALRLGSRAEAAVARRGLRRAVRLRRLPARTAAGYEAILARSLAQLEGMASAEAASLASVLRDVAVHARVYDGPRARVLFTMLETNARYLGAQPRPRGTIDIRGGDGAIYRFFAGHGFQFHPLANFVQLKAYISLRRPDDAARLVSVLLPRAVELDGVRLWEYYFSVGGPPRWTSAFVQALAADVLARSPELLVDARLRRVAASAYRALPGRLTQPLAGGLWIREYSFSDIAILNAQLESLLSLLSYAELTGDAAARELARQLEAASRALLRRFDTGCWSLYSLGGARASLKYHTYHVSLLKRLAARTQDPLWREVAGRWAQALPPGSKERPRRGGPCSRARASGA